MKPEEEVSERLTNPDPFALPRRVQEALSCCCTEGVHGEDISYLWLHVTETGIGQGAGEGGHDLSLDEWLSIIDEAAAGGVQNMMVSVLTLLSSHKDWWEICSWAQRTHGMDVGIYTNGDSISGDDLAQFRRLNPAQTRIYVRKDVLEQVSDLADEGFRVADGDVDLKAGSGCCSFPVRMVFVNAQGVLYTCGKVEGHVEHCLGTAFEGRLSEILSDTNLPHEIANLGSPNQNACNGCPPLLARYFKGD